jgi:hypothetical protein
VSAHAIRPESPPKQPNFWALKPKLLTVPDSGPHATLFAAELSPPFARFLDSHALLHQKSFDAIAERPWLLSLRAFFRPKNLEGLVI